MLQSEHMIKRRYLGLAAVFFVILAGATYYGRTALADQLSPDTSGSNLHAHYTLRYHESGSVLKIPLSVYAPVGVTPVADYRVNSFSIIPTGLECKPSSNTEIKLEITVGGRRAYKHSLTHESCKDNAGADAVYKLYDLVPPSPTTGNGDWIYEESTNRWRADITLTLMDGDNQPQSWYNSDARKAFFHFRFNANGNLIVRNRTNDIDAGGDKRNYGITQGKDYKINFAQPCSDESERTVRAGMWDPDGFDTNKMRIQQRPRSGGAWENTPLVESPHGMSGTKDSNNFYQLNSGERSSAYFKFKMSQAMEYQLHYVTEPGNVVSLFWPNDSIQAEVDCRYDLTPQTILSHRTISPGETLRATSNVANTNPTPQPRGNWYFTRFVLNSGNISSIEKSLRDAPDGPPPCSYFGTSDCTMLQGSPGSDNYLFNLSIQGRYYDSLIKTEDIGKRICYVTSVSKPVDAPRRNANNVWRHSNISCALVAKQPKVHMLGADLRVQGKINASVTEGSVGGNTFGSWMEYGAFSGGLNSSASSGGGLRGGNLNNLSGKKQWSGLTFANNSSAYGSYGTVPKANNGTYFKNIGPAKSWTGNVSESGVYDAGTNAALSRIEINDKSRSIIIRATGTVKITDDIIIADGLEYANAKDISQIVIVANKIDIGSNVNRVDAWLVADTINTCSDKPAQGLTVNSGAPCITQLTINGPVDTNNLQLNRTFGATAEDPEVAAEIFNLRPSVYMWAYNYINQQDRARTVNVTELAPRL